MYVHDTYECPTWGYSLLLNRQSSLGDFEGPQHQRKSGLDAILCVHSIHMAKLSVLMHKFTITLWLRLNFRKTQAETIYCFTQRQCAHCQAGSRYLVAPKPPSKAESSQTSIRQTQTTTTTTTTTTTPPRGSSSNQSRVWCTCWWFTVTGTPTRGGGGYWQWYNSDSRGHVSDCSNRTATAGEWVGV